VCKAAAVAATVECARQHCEDIFTGSASNLSDAGA
jgi:hypothetical protein